MNSTSILTGSFKKIICAFLFLVSSVIADAQPVLDWYKQTVSGSSEVSREILVDKFNNVYVSGELSGLVDFDDGPGILQYQTEFSKSFFVCKYNPSGSLIWMKTLDLKSNHRIFVDDSCNVIVVGNFSGVVDFDPDSGIFNLNATGGALYLLKLDSAGTFIWARNLDTLGNTNSSGFIKGDSQGNLYIASLISSLSKTIIVKYDNAGTLLWEKSFGISIFSLRMMNVDDSGNVFIGGVFSSIVDFDPDAGTAMLDASLGAIFITKLNSMGALTWAKNFGGVNYPVAMAIAEGSNKIIVTGRLANAADFDPGIDSTILIPPGSYYIPFFVQFDSLGNFLWANTINGYSECNAICTDNLGNIVMTGYFNGVVDFDPDTSVFNLPYFGSGVTFVCKFNPDGNFVNAVSFGNRFGFSIAAGLNNDVFITGNFKEIVDMDPSGATFNLQTEMDYSIFINKLDSSFNFQWAQSIVGSEIYVLGSHSDDNGNSYSSGVFYGTVDLDPDSALVLFESANEDKIFIRKISTTGEMTWVKIVEGTFSRTFHVLKSDNDGNLFLLGVLAGPSDLDPGPGVYNLNVPVNSQGAYFILKLDSSGNFVWAKVISNIPNSVSDTVNYISDMVVDGSGSIILSGTFQTLLDADPGAGTYNITSPDYYDVYILKLNSSGIFEWVKQIGNPNDYEESNSLKLDGFGNIYLSGYFIDEVDFDPGPGIFLEYPNDWAPSFILKLNPKGEFIWVRQISFYDYNGSNTYTPELEVTEDGTWYATALFEGCLDFDPGIGIDTAWAVTNGTNYYISKWSSSGSLIWKVITPQIFNSSSITPISMCVDYSNNLYCSAPESNFINIYMLNDSGGTSFQSSLLGKGFLFDGIDHQNNLYTTNYISRDYNFDFYGGGSPVILSGTADIVIAKYNAGNPACSVSPTGIASNVVGNTLCLGQDAVLTQLGGMLSAGGNFKWYTDSCGGTLIGNGPSTVVSPTDTTTYFLRTEDSCGVSTCLSITLFIDTPPAPPTITGNGLFCSGDSIVLDAGPGFSGYVWSTGSLVQTTPITSNGQYQVTVTDVNGCTSSTSINATTYPDPPVAVSPSSYAEMCLGDSVQFIATFDPDYTYQWYVNSTPILGANNYYFNAFSSGRYSAMVTDLNMCDSVSNSVRVRIVCFPPMEDEVKISGEDIFEGPAFYANYDGIYEKLNISAIKLKGLNYALQIIDLSGRVIFDSMGRIENFSINKAINCSSFANSMYMVTVKTESEQLKTKFVKY